jgi:hypothetical protein
MDGIIAILFTLGGLLIGITFYLWNKGMRKDEDLYFKFSIFSVVIAAILLVLAVNLVNMPRAIDVYRDKTRLQITSVDGVPTDTTVVWKNRN